MSRLGRQVLIFAIGHGREYPGGRETARQIHTLLQREPIATLTILMDGFNDDPREVFDIPEALQRISEVGFAMSQYRPHSMFVTRLDNDSRILVELGMGFIRRDQVHIPHVDGRVKPAG